MRTVYAWLFVPLFGAAIIMTGCSGSKEEVGAPAQTGNNDSVKTDTPAEVAQQAPAAAHAKDAHEGRKAVPPADVIAGLPPDGGPEYNRLVFEKSPYLLQHCGNPVDWYPWGPEAFEKAKQENKPIFLSVGYSTCHWCHVMERESFEKQDAADILNKYFVAIKVDREERPDIDHVYMTFVQSTTGGGGWPMSVWMTPELKPFVGGTYFPPTDGYGRPGFKSILLQIAKAWDEQRDQILASGDTIVQRLKQASAVKASGEAQLGADLLDQTYRQIRSQYEPRYGGFGGAPKFPRPVAPNFMLRYHARTGTKDALDTTLFTLDKMYDGGMYDHLGGGFHRYSVDNEWHVPHFEKMMYDQGQLVCTYLEAYQITRNSRYARVASNILEYVMRDMTGEHGQFYSAEDADSPIPENPEEQAEGAFYVWEHGQVAELLSPDDTDLFNYYYDVQKGSNVGSDPHGEFRNKNVLIVRRSLEKAANAHNKTPEEVERILDAARTKLLAVRSKRPRPHLDDKTISAWNGLMISGFARAYQVLGDPRYLQAARQATQFIRDKLYDENTGVLLRRYRDGEAAIDGYVDDYAYFIQALLDLYEANFNIADLTWAVALQKKQNELFFDDVGGGYFNTSGQDASILIRMKEDYDGAEPSPNSIALMNLLRLTQMTNDETFRLHADKTLAGFSTHLKRAPHAMPQMMVAFSFSLDKPRQIIIAGKPGAADTRAMFKAVHEQYVPNKVLLLADGGAGQAQLAKYVEVIGTLSMLDGKATAYVCENYACQLPTTDVKKLVELLRPKTDS